jgi:hypothetical protein
MSKICIHNLVHLKMERNEGQEWQKKTVKTSFMELGTTFSQTLPPRQLQLYMQPTLPRDVEWNINL